MPIRQLETRREKAVGPVGRLEGNSGRQLLKSHHPQKWRKRFGRVAEDLDSLPLQAADSGGDDKGEAASVWLSVPRQSVWFIQCDYGHDGAEVSLPLSEADRRERTCGSVHLRPQRVG